MLAESNPNVVARVLTKDYKPDDPEEIKQLESLGKGMWLCLVFMAVCMLVCGTFVYICVRVFYNHLATKVFESEYQLWDEYVIIG